MDQPTAVIVEGSGRKDVDGTYVPHQRMVLGQPVFRKPGTSLTVLRRGDSSWGLADYAGRGIETLRWSPQSADLYSVGRCVAGLGAHQPPEVGWEAHEAAPPAPSVRTWHNGNRTGRLRVELTEAAVTIADGVTSDWLGRSRSEPRSWQVSARHGLEPRSREIIPPWAPAASRSTPPAMSSRLRGEKLEAHTSSSPQKASAKMPASTPSTSALPGHERLLLVFSIVLARQSPRIGWGIAWDHKEYASSGCRKVGSIAASSPLGRWNVWQGVRGRADLQVRLGDQLLKADGKWAFPECEAGTDDVLTESVSSSRVQMGSAVLDFGRWVVRPSRPQPPEVSPWRNATGLLVSWANEVQAARRAGALAWALCLRDAELGQWYVVDGATGHVEKLTLGKEFRAIAPNETSLVLYGGLSRGRNYTACIAMLTAAGWSSFSFLSRQVSTSMTLYGSRSRSRLLALAQGQQLPMGSEEVPPPPLVPPLSSVDLPSFMTPAQIQPGGSAPVALKNGPRTLLALPRVLSLRLCLEGAAASDGVVARALGDRSVLIEAVDRTAPVGSAGIGGGWASLPAGRRCSQPLDIHGERLVPDLRPGDAVIRMNGLMRAADMLGELKRRPPTLALLILRWAGGPRPGEPRGKEEVAAAAASAESQSAEAFDVDAGMDGELSSLVEDLKRVSLLPSLEAEVAMRLANKDIDALNGALEALRQQRHVEAGDGAEDTAAGQPLGHEDPDKVSEPGLAEEAQKRCHLLNNRRRLEDGLKEIYVMSDSEEDQNHFKANVSLRCALADPSFDPDQLKMAVDTFFRLCPHQANSLAAATVIARARMLEQLWRQRRLVEELALKLPAAARAAVTWEAQRRRAGTWPHAPCGVEADPPPDIALANAKLLSVGREYAAELGYAYLEAAAVQERHDWAARQRPPKSDAFRKDNMTGPMMSLRLGELEGWWKRPVPS